MMVRSGRFPLRPREALVQLLLVRHAKAFERDPAAWPDDRGRPLTAEGRRAFARFARQLGRLVPEVDLLESSRLVRAWQTAQLLHEEAGWPKPSRLEALEDLDAPDATAPHRTLLHMRGIGRLAWVGHEPLLGRLASTVLTGDPDALPIAFKKGAVVAIELDAADPDVRGRLAWMLTPSVARRLRSA